VVISADGLMPASVSFLSGTRLGMGRFVATSATVSGGRQGEYARLFGVLARGKGC
jgi:hypothetical protein